MWSAVVDHEEVKEEKQDSYWVELSKAQNSMNWKDIWDLLINLSTKKNTYHNLNGIWPQDSLTKQIKSSYIWGSRETIENANEQVGGVGIIKTCPILLLFYIPNFIFSYISVKKPVRTKGDK